MLRKRSFVTSAAIKNPLGVVVVVVVVVVVIAGRQGALREEQTDAPSWLGQPKELILCAGLPIAVANLLIGASFQTGTCHTNFRCPLSIAPKRHRAGGPHSLPPPLASTDKGAGRSPVRKSAYGPKLAPFNHYCQ